ncbi:hypothetical protein QUF58_07980 [Anaerolineales bacterium HSG24]|nr:hypothetical protein [Anaerolineales bacterium HSG24]
MKTKILFISHFIAITVLFFNTGSYRNWPYKIESDGKYYYQYLISVWYDGDIDFANNYNHAKHSFMKLEIDHYRFREHVIPETGLPTNIFTTGSAILWSPFFLIAYGIAYILNNLHVTAIPLDGWGQYFQYAVMYASVIYSTLTLILMYKLLSIYFSRYISLVTSFVLFWATNWMYYSIFEVSMSHTYDLFTLVLFVWFYLDTQNKKIGHYLVTGLLAALHVLVRTQNLLTIVIFVGYYIIWSSLQTKKSLFLTLQKQLPFVAMFLLGLLPLFFTNVYIYGDIFTIPQGNNFLNLSQPELYGVLLSGRNGLFSHHPVLLLGVLGLLVVIPNYKMEKVCLNQIVIPLLLIFIVQLYINSTVADWWAGHSFGQRRFISSFLLFAFGLAYLQKYIYKFVPKSEVFIMGIFVPFILTNFLLTYIHLFFWGYDESHNILDWIFYKALPFIYYNYIITFFN